MSQRLGRRKFLKTVGTGAVVLIGAACAPAAVPTPAPTAAPKPAATTAPAPAAPAATAPPAPQPTAAPAVQPTAAPKPAVTAPAQAAAGGDRIVVAVGAWGSETPIPWRHTQGEKPLWDHVYEPLILRDPKTFEYRPGLALSWDHSSDYKAWTFKLRQGVMFHENYGEMTSEDVKFTVEKLVSTPDAQGPDVAFFKTHLDGVDTPDKYTVVLRLKNPLWEIPAHFTQFTYFMNIASKKHVESVGEEKAALQPIGTGPYRHVEGQQGSFHRFAAVPNHWRITPAFKELVVRRMPDPAARVAALRAGEVDITQVFGDYLKQARQAGFKIHTTPGGSQYWVVLPGQHKPDLPDYDPKVPWVGAPDAQGQENARKVRLALNLAVNKQAIVDGLWQGTGNADPFMYFYFPFDKGFNPEWKVPPYDPQRAKQLLTEAGYPNGFEMKVNPMIYTYAQDGPDVMEAIALDWERIGLKVKRVPEDVGSFTPKFRAGKTGNTAWVYGSVRGDEPNFIWQRVLWTKASFHIVGESDEYDKLFDAVWTQFDADKRALAQRAAAQKMYDDLRTVLIGTKQPTWALSKKIGEWASLVSIPLENNYEYITPAKQ